VLNPGAGREMSLDESEEGIATEGRNKMNGRGERDGGR